MKKYICRSIVYGNCWGGGQVGYKGELITGNTREEVLKEANERLKDGSLDSGMGFESLVGALCEIEEIETIIVERNEFKHSEFERHEIGEIPDDFVDTMDEFLGECWYHL